METKKVILKDTNEKEVNEILSKDYLVINGETYMKKSKVLKLMKDFIYHQERNGKIKILNNEGI